jgi:type I restriction enzyme S subunit
MNAWPIRQLSEVVEVGSGSGFPIADQGKQDEAFPFLKVSDMNLPGNERSILVWNNSICESVRTRLRATAFPAGSVIFPKIGAAIATNKKRLLTRPSCVDNNVMALVPDRSLLEPDFLYFLLLAKDISDFASDSNPPSIRKTTVEAWRVGVPALAEQRRIVDLLSRAEGIVRLRREAQAKAQAIIPALFLDMFGDPATNPKGWPDSDLDSLLTDTKLGLVRGAKEMGQDRAYAYLRMDAVGDGLVRLRDLRRVDASPKEVNAYSLRAGDFLFNTRNSRELVGKTGLVMATPDQPVLFNNNLMRMRFDERVLLPVFVNWQFQTLHIQRQLESIKRGTTTVFAIYYKDLKNIRLRIPPLELQARFVDFALAAASIIAQQVEALKKAEATFQALLARAFSGDLVSAPAKEAAVA